MRTALYRHFAADESLLYVGVSLSWPERTKAHSRKAEWFEQIARVSIEWFETREAALQAERMAIKSERPKFNVVHNRDVKARPHANLPPINTSPDVCRFLPKIERQRSKDPLFNTIVGPDALVGPALIYREDVFSVIVAHGSRGQSGILTEIVLGNHVPNAMPEWAESCCSVIEIRRATDLTMDDAKALRTSLVERLRCGLRIVTECHSDFALAEANLRWFPSADARRVFEEVSLEKGAAR